MKKTFLLLFALSTFLLGCDSDDDDNGNKSIIGDWEYNRIIIIELEGRSVNYDITDLMETSGNMVFYENGTCKLIYNEIVEWKYHNNQQTAVRFYFPIDEEDREERDDKVDIQIVPYEISDNELILTDNDFYLENSDRYPDEGNISYSDFNEQFNENIDTDDDLEVTAKIIFLRN